MRRTVIITVAVFCLALVSTATFAQTTPPAASAKPAASASAPASAPAPAAGWNRFEKWDLSLDYPAAMTPMPQEGVVTIKEGMVKDFDTAKAKGLLSCGDRVWSRAAAFSENENGLMMIVTAMKFAKAPGVDALLKERQACLDEDKKTGEIAKLVALKKLTLAGLDAVREDVDVADGSHGIIIHLLHNDTVYQIAWLAQKAGGVAIAEKKITEQMPTIRLSPNTDPVVKSKSFSIRLSPGWTRSDKAQENIEAMFTKPLPGGGNAVIIVTAAAYANESADAMRHGYEAGLKKNHPDLVAGAAPPVDLGGRFLFENIYKYKQGELSIKNLAIVAVDKQTSFFVMCLTPETAWDGIFKDFDRALATITLNGESGRRTDAEAVTEITRSVKEQIAAWPAGWAATPSGAAIAAKPAGRTASITIKWPRADLAALYKATKAGFAWLRDGKAGDPPELKTVVQADYNQLCQSLGQISGRMYAATRPCQTPVVMFQMVILDAQGKRIGAVTISAKDLAEIAAGKMTDNKKIGAAYKFE